MKAQSILFLASVAAGTVHAHGPAMDHNEGMSVHNENPYDNGSPAQNVPSFGDTDQYEEDCAAWAGYPKFAGDGEGPHVPPHCKKEGGEKKKKVHSGEMAAKRDDDLRDDIGNAVGDVGDQIRGGGDGPNGGDDNGDDGPGDRNAAAGKTIPLLGVASLVAVSFLVLT